ncbi:MAG: hypothetical protein ABIT08_16005 [Bacteroidia bacterium]
MKNKIISLIIPGSLFLFNIGINATPEGKISDILFTIEINFRGIFWASAAVPDLRIHAPKLDGNFIMGLEKRKKKLLCAVEKKFGKFVVQH